MAHDLATTGSRAERGRQARGASAAASVYATLRAEILSLARPPGAKIVEKDVAEANRVSRTPVREAVLALADEGLVDVMAKSGTYVSRIPIDTLPEAIVIRRALEQVTARAAVDRASESDVLSLRAILARQREVAAAGDRERFHAVDEALHGAIAAIGGYPGIWTLVRQVKLQMDRYRRLTLPLAGRMDRAIAEHEAIVDAIAAREADRAVDAMARHIDGLSESLEQVHTLNPDFFVSTQYHPTRSTRS